jgi:hypothetical protein
MTGTVVEWHALWQTIWTAAVAGLGVTVIFSIAVMGAGRSQDRQNDGHGPAALAYGVLAVVALLATLGAIAWGIVLIATK